VAGHELELNAPATLRKWPSLNNERISSAWGAVPYLIHEGKLVECICKFASYPLHTRPLYEIHITAKAGSPMVLSPRQIEPLIELARFQDFL
jgi:hypothetical protein